MRRGSAARVARCVVLCLMALSGMMAAPVATRAQEPSPDGGVSGPVDPRSDGGGPGLEAEPLLVLLGVIVLGAATAAGTVVVVRITRRD